jgi:macrolide-specific efflux system membrane fusion protein
MTFKPPLLGRINLRATGMGLVVTLAAIALVFGLNRPKAAPTAPASATVELGDIEQTVQASGVLQPKLKVDVGAQVNGQVRKLHVKLGEWVRAGAPLISLDSEASRNAVQQAEAQLAQQSAAVQRAQVDLDAARHEAERQRRLLKSESTSAAEQEQADSALGRAQADMLGQQATLAQRRADLADKQLQLSRAEVLAPVDGQVVNLAVQEGQSLNAANSSPTLLTLAQMHTVTAKARVAEADIGQVHVGQMARFTTLAAGARRYRGRVEVVQPIPERLGSALFYNVLFDVDNTDGQLLSDMTAQVDLEVAQAKGVPLLPVAALEQHDAKGNYTVQVLDAAGQTSSRSVRVGLRDDAHAQILEGLKAGERVVLGLAAAPALPASAASAAH